MYRSFVQMSRDPEIRGWLRQREGQLRDVASKWQPSRDINSLLMTTPKMLRETVEELYRQAKLDVASGTYLEQFRLSGDKELDLFNVKAEMREFFSEPARPVVPIGDRDHARIAIILDDKAIDMDEVSGGLPTNLAAIGLHIKNSLIWTYNHTNPGFLDANLPGTPTQDECDSFSRHLIQYSPVRVVLLSGELSQRSILQAFNLIGPCKLLLRGLKIVAWLQAEEGKLLRIFIQTPDLLGIGLLTDLSLVHSIGEIFRLASFLTGVPLRCYHFETTSAIARILRQRHFFKQHSDLEPKGAVALDLTLSAIFFGAKAVKSDADIT